MSFEPAAQPHADRAQAAATAATLSRGALEQLTAELLDLADQHGWDRPAALYGVIDLDELPDELRRSLGQRVTGVTVDGDTTSVAVAVAKLGDLDGEVYDLLRGYTAPAEVAAVALITEAWVSAATDDTAPLYRAGRRGPDGRFEARMAVLVTLTGSEVYALQIRDAGREISVRDAFDLRDDWHDPNAALQRFSGRIDAALRRSLDLPARPPTVRPWPVLADAWAELSRRVLDGCEDRSERERLAWQLTRDRPDLVAAEMSQMAARTVAFLERHAGSHGLVSPSQAPDPLAAMRANVARLSDLPAELDAEYRRTVRPSEVLTDLQVDHGERIHLLDTAGEDAAELLAETGWDAVHAATVQHVLSTAPPEERDLLTRVDPRWWDGPAALYELARFSGRQGAAQDGALLRLADDPALPGWFRSQAAALHRRVEALAELPPTHRR